MEGGVVTIFFPDVSHYNAGANLTGAAALIAKATQGVSSVDPTFAAFRAQAAGLGIPFVAYHWVDDSDPLGQAQHAYSVAGAVPMMWDAEAVGADVARLVEMTHRYRALGGNPRLVYLPHWWWVDLGSPDLRPLTAAGLALVSSDYPAAGYSDTGPGWAPYGQVGPVIWQYTDSPIDHNAYRGTVDQLRALLGLTTPPGANMRVISVADGPQASFCFLCWVGPDGVLRRRSVPTVADVNALVAVTGLPVVSVPSADLPHYGVDVTGQPTPAPGGTVDPAAIASAVVADMAADLGHPA
jgi:hypothetical protein